MAALEAEGLGLPVLEGVVVPIVPAAVLFDLQLGSAGVRPTAQWGAKAALDATSAPVGSGNLGAGTGATVGKLAGPERATKGGLGNALREFDDGVLVGALAAVNAVGEVFDSATGQTIAGVRATAPGCYESAVDLALGTLESGALIGTNTTLGVIATNVQLSKAQLKKVAEMAHDGLARAVRPVHTSHRPDRKPATLSEGAACGRTPTRLRASVDELATSSCRAAAPPRITTRPAVGGLRACGTVTGSVRDTAQQRRRATVKARCNHAVD